MTVREFIKARPYDPDQWPYKSHYIRWVISEFQDKTGSTTTYGYVRKKLHEHEQDERTRMIDVRETLDADGNVKSVQRALRNVPQHDTTGMRLRRVSVSNSGIEWAQFVADSVDYEEAIDKAIDKYVGGQFRQYRRAKDKKEKAMTGTMSDMHVGLDPSDGLFEYEWNRDVLNKCMSLFFNSLVDHYDLHGRFETLFLYDLGDSMDGYNKKTTRGDHELKQNMTDTEAFDTYVDAKLTLLENVLQADIADRIVIRNVTNDNHSGEFGHIANRCIQKIVERVWPNRFSFHNLTKFIEHFEYGKHVDMLTHGKDMQYMRSGMPFELTPKAEKFIASYIKHHNLSGYLHLLKGDLHQVGYKATNLFDYRNFMSFAPPSGWVQINFGDTYSGYTIMVYPKWENEVSVAHRFFEMSRKK